MKVFVLPGDAMQPPVSTRAVFHVPSGVFGGSSLRARCQALHIIRVLVG
jgi:hypothetical protein